MSVAISRPVIMPELVQQHIDRATSLLPGYRAEGIIVFRRSNILAFCGVPLEPTDRLVCGIINADGRVAFVVPAFEAEQAATLPPGSEVATWEEHQDPYAAVATAVQVIGLDSAALLVDGHMWLSARAALKAALPRATLIDDTGLIETVRIRKSDEEVSAIRAACEDTGRIYPLVAQRLRPGVTESELAREVIDTLQRAGVSPHGELIQGGENASIPHVPTGSRRFVNGDSVIVDFVAERDSYLGDMTRTFAVGQPSEVLVQAYTAVREAQRAAIKAIRPGVECQEIDRIARDVIENAGFGGYFTHRLGHGIGIDVHEPPYLVRGNALKLQPGMCMTVEPGVYVPGRFGVRIEDVVAVTDTGCEVLSNAVATDMSEALR